MSHFGKLDNAAATLIAQDVIAALKGVSSAACVLVSRIGAPIDEPEPMNVRLRIDDGRRASELSSAVGEIARERRAAGFAVY